MIFATYSITDDRKQKVSFAGPYFVAGQDLLVKADNTDITGPDVAERQEAVLGDRLDVGEEDQGQLRRPVCSCRSTTPTPSASRPSTAGTIDAVTTDNVILAGFAAQPQYQGKLKVVGKPFSEEHYGVGIKKGDTALCEQDQRRASRRWSTDGAWQKALDDTVGPSGFKPDAATNPPKPDACS